MGGRRAWGCGGVEGVGRAGEGGGGGGGGGVGRRVGSKKKVTNKKSRTSYSLAVNMRAARFMFREQL